MKRALSIGVGLVLASVACNPEQSLSEVLEGKSCRDAEPRCVYGYGCLDNVCVPLSMLSDAGDSSGGAIGNLSPAGAGGAPQEVSTTDDPVVVGGQGGAAGSASSVAGSSGTSSVDPPAVGEADAGCATMVELFRDLDGDGYGSAASGHQTSGCPEEGWVERGDDCFDAEVTAQNRANLVHPDQAMFFELGYPLPGGQAGEVSFDYDCDGQEQPDPDNTRLGVAGDCTATAANSCNAANGFVPTERSGSGVNNLCGSEDLQTCMRQSEQCVLGVVGRVDPFLCH